MFATKKLVRSGALVLAIGAMSCFMSSDVMAQRHGHNTHHRGNNRGNNRSGISISFSSGRGLNFNYGRGGPSRGYVAGYGFGGYRAPVFTRPSRVRYDTSHVDYHRAAYVRHGNHYDYVPGHYDVHRAGHWGY